jgi:DNA-binding MarR family transcriptional regulator
MEMIEMLATKNGVLVTEKKSLTKTKTPPRLNHVSYKILKILEGRDWVEFDELLEKIGMSPRTVRYRLYGLIDMNFVERKPNLYDLRSFLYRVKKNK